jgi:hypothetical protein
MRTMRPTAIVVTVTCTTANGFTRSFSHPADSGESFLNSLLLAALPAVQRIADCAGADADPYEIRDMHERLTDMYEDERIRLLSRDLAAIRADKLTQAWEASKW